MGVTWRIWLVHSTSNRTLQVSQIINPQDKSRTNIIRSRITPQNISYATDVFHGCNLSCRTRSNLCTTEYITCKIFNKIRACTQGSIGYPSRSIQKNNPPSSTSEGSIQGVRPKETPINEPGRNPTEKDTSIKSSHQCITSEGDYCRGIPR